MITIANFIDVLNGISKTLKDSFKNHEIYVEEIRENMVRPSFFIALIPESSFNFNKYYRQQNILVDISYFSESDPDLQSNIENLSMANEIQNVLNTGIKVLDREINLQELQFDVIDRVLHATFNLMWYNVNEITQAELDKYKLMQDIQFEYSYDSLQALMESNNKYVKSINQEQIYVEGGK